MNRPTPTQKWRMQRHRPSPAEKARHEPQDKMQHPLSPTKSDDTLPRQQDLPMLLVCTKNIVLPKHLQRQHGSKALSILTYMPKVYLLCGGRDTQEQVLKSLTTPDWPAQCDGGTRRKYMCCDQPRYSCSLRSGPEAEFCPAKASQLLCQHLSHSSLRSCTKCLQVTCAPVSSAVLVTWGPPHRAHSRQPRGNTRKSRAFYKARGTTFPTATLLTAQLTLCYA